MDYGSERRFTFIDVTELLTKYMLLRVKLFIYYYYLLFLYIGISYMTPSVSQNLIHLIVNLKAINKYKISLPRRLFGRVLTNCNTRSVFFYTTTNILRLYYVILLSLSSVCRQNSCSVITQVIVDGAF